MTGATGKRIVLSTFGSFGDIHPYVAIALELKAHGHSVVIATSEVYREKMDALGLEFHPVRPLLPALDDPDEFSRLAEGLMDPKGGTERVFGILTPHLRDAYDDLDAVVAGADLLLTHPLPFVGPLVAQKRKLPWVSSVLAPISFSRPLIRQCFRKCLRFITCNAAASSSVGCSIVSASASWRSC